MTQMWHERALRNGNVFSAHVASCHGLIGKKHIVGDRTGARLYEMSDSAYTDNGTAIRRLRRAPHTIKKTAKVGRARHSHKALRLIMDTGSSSPAAGNPTIGMRYSNDAGKTWSALQYKDFGADAQYGANIEWRRLGSSGHVRQYEIVTEADVPATLIAAYGDIQ